MSSTAERYRDGVALWAAATDRAKAEAVARGANSGALLRQLVNDRFLARVFHAPHARRLYPPLARTVRKCEGLTTFPSAVELVGRFLGPALDGSAAGRRWSFDLARWEPGLEVHATENP